MACQHCKENEFERLLRNLEEGKLSSTHIAIALSSYYKDAKHLPIEIRNLIGGVGEGSGLIHKYFRMMGETIGSLELAARRGRSNPEGLD